VGERFATFHDFASASLQEIYTPECLKQSHLFSANTLESGILINDGDGCFQFQPLPMIAQASPSFGVVVTDFDGDGTADIYLAQNFFGPQTETGRMDGGVSLLLRGHVDVSDRPGFTPVWPNLSGIVVSGDATAAVCADANGDGRPDLLVAVNDGRVRSFQNQVDPTNNQFLSVDLQNQFGAPAVGARLEVVLSDKSRQVAELYAGAGYLSQSTPILTFGLGVNRTVDHVSVRWADGNTNVYNDVRGKTKLRIRRER
jgi:hypothetical protein